jgi:hypothetical protein
MLLDAIVVISHSFCKKNSQYLDSLKADPPELTAQIEYANALKRYYKSK